MIGFLKWLFGNESELNKTSKNRDCDISSDFADIKKFKLELENQRLKNEIEQKHKINQ